MNEVGRVSGCHCQLGREVTPSRLAGPKVAGLSESGGSASGRSLGIEQKSTLVGGCPPSGEGGYGGESKVFKAINRQIYGERDAGTRSLLAPAAPALVSGRCHPGIATMHQIQIELVVVQHGRVELTVCTASHRLAGGTS